MTRLICISDFVLFNQIGIVIMILFNASVCVLAHLSRRLTRLAYRIHMLRRDLSCGAGSMLSGHWFPPHVICPALSNYLLCGVSLAFSAGLLFSKKNKQTYETCFN